MGNLFTVDIRTNAEAQERVRAWIDALRSGRYSQAREALRQRSGGYCCLGVACDVYDPSRWIIRTDNWLYIYPGGCALTELPFDIRDAYCLIGVAGEFEDGESGGPDRDGACLAEYNDELGIGHRSFAQIADIIEANLQERLEEE